MKEILFLAHRIPYPPDKGDKIRSFHLLERLAKDYRVHVGAFVDDAGDWRYAQELERLGGEVCLLPLSPRRAKLRSLKGLTNGKALTFPYYRDRKMDAWVTRVLNERVIHAVVAFSSAMTQYAGRAGVGGARRIVDLVDLDSDKWRQYAASQAWPWRWVYRREARRLAEAERRIALDFDASVLVSDAERRLFSERFSEAGQRVTVIRNGVDTERFSPAHRGASPYPPATKALVFTGAMDYWPNVDAVAWFAREIFPLIRARIDNVEFYIVGSHPRPAVRRLSREPKVTVTGRVPDVRPYIGHARLVVAPLRVARGVQNKVLEAMAMAKPVLTTSAAMAGIDAGARFESLVADAPCALADRAVELLNEPPLALGDRCRQFVTDRFNWQRNLGRLNALIDGEPTTRPALAHAV